MVRAGLFLVVLISALGGLARADSLIGMAGPMADKGAWFGAQMERGAAMAVADLDAAGGVLTGAEEIGVRIVLIGPKATDPLGRLREF